MTGPAIAAASQPSPPEALARTLENEATQPHHTDARVHGITWGLKHAAKLVREVLAPQWDAEITKWQARYAGRTAELNAARAAASEPRFRQGNCPVHPGQAHVQVLSNDQWLCLRGLIALHEPPARSAGLSGAQAVVLEFCRRIRSDGNLELGDLVPGWLEAAEIDPSELDAEP